MISMGSGRKRGVGGNVRGSGKRGEGGGGGGEEKERLMLGRVKTISSSHQNCLILDRKGKSGSWESGKF